MKKFLFTLAALLMVGSVSAAEYLYIDDFEVSQELLAQTAGKNRRMDIPVKAHFDNYTSAWEVTLTLPEGVQLKNGVEGADMTIHTMDAVGNDKDIPVTLNMSLENFKFIAANAGAGYYWPEGADPDEDDPVSVGAAKWIGDYAEMFIVTLQFAQDFAGGDLNVKTVPGSGADPRGPVTDGATQNKVCHISVEATQPVELTGNLVIGEVDQETGKIVVTYDGPEAVTVTATYAEVVRGGETTVQLPDYGTYNIHAEAAAEGYVTKEADATRTWEAPAPEPWNDAVVTNMGVVDGWLTYKIEWEEGADLYIDGEKVEGVSSPYMYKVAAEALYDQEGSFFVQVKGGDRPDSNNNRYAWELPARPATYAPVPTLEWDADNYVMTVTVPEGYSVVVTTPNGTETITETTEYPFVQQTYVQQGTFSAYTLAKTEDYQSAVVSKPYYVPAKELEKTPTPEIVIDTEMKDGRIYQYVEFHVNAVEGAEVHVYDGEGNEIFPDDNGHYKVYADENEQTIHIITATAQEEGKAISDPATKTIILPANPDAVNELNANKTVAGVRYFNMAGQEMQEANGVTIVVTTYTDGTTSAVKVMK